MGMTPVSRKTTFFPSLALLLLLFLLPACGGTPSSPTSTRADSTYEPATPHSTVAMLTPPDEGVAATIPAGLQPEIAVDSGSAKLLTFVGADTTNISTNLYALPYKKKGNQVTISFGQTISQALEIQIPRRASLTVTVTEGNVRVENFQGTLNVTLTRGTIQLHNMLPRGVNTIQTENGTIDLTLAQSAACHLSAQTRFGAIVSAYPALSAQRSGEGALVNGVLHGGAQTTVNLIVHYGSITIGPVR
jgi:hypothetical protein